MARTDIAHICPDCDHAWLEHSRSPDGVISYCPADERVDVEGSEDALPP